MSERAFFRPETREKAADAVREVESQTCAEIVIALRRSSGNYRQADLLFGFVAALVTLGAILLVPQPFDPAALPLNQIVGFVIGAALCAWTPRLRRALLPNSLLRANVRSAARAAFYELGVSRTRARSGVLVFVSVFEQRVELVPDVGIDLVAIGERWDRIGEELDRAVRARDVEALLAGIRALGPALAESHPRSIDDVNELCDEVSAS
jgi:putative membrane protein